MTSNTKKHKKGHLVMPCFPAPQPINKRFTPKLNNGSTPNNHIRSGNNRSERIKKDKLVPSEEPPTTWIFVGSSLQ